MSVHPLTSVTRSVTNWLMGNSLLYIFSWAMVARILNFPEDFSQGTRGCLTEKEPSSTISVDLKQWFLI